ncbi:MAG TPA: hydrogenase 4 subunit B, partial [Pseudonocardia sp.]|nr:hydrogenase 4 subunit B [Pseudonocardia sp.]
HRGTRRVAPAWEGGAPPVPGQAAYTAPSFAEPLRRVFDDVVDRAAPERLERRLYRPALAALAAWGRAGRRLATGGVHRYLGYGFYAVCGALVLLVVTR